MTRAGNSDAERQSTPNGGPDRRPRGKKPPPLFEVRRQVRSPGEKFLASYSLAEPGECGRHIVARTREGLICTCHEFQLWRKGPAAEGCKHLRALVSYGLL